jgi:WD repeat-containing protein 24
MVTHYCVTGSADGDLRVWVRQSIMPSHMEVFISCQGSTRHVQISHEDPPSDFCAKCGILPQSVAASSSGCRFRQWQHLPVWVLSFFLVSHLITRDRWDLQMGQRGLLDRLPVAHSGPILALDWCNSPGLVGPPGDGGPLNGMGWLASGGLDRTVKVF